MNRNELEEVFLSSQEVFHGKLINVEHWQVRLPNGQTALREVVKHRGAAAIVPVDDQGNVTLVCQHRVAVGRFTWEIPAGKLDHTGEDMLAAAKRELRRIGSFWWIWIPRPAFATSISASIWPRA